MGLLSKLKSMLGLQSSERAPGSGVDVTVEHEPDDEPVADGTDAAASTESLVDDDSTDDPDLAAEPAEAAGSAASDDEDDDYVTTDAEVGSDPADATPEDDADTETEPDDDADADSEPEPDDLTDIKGVGPAYADRLNDAGITTFAALADADADDLAAETDLSPKRVGRWIDRAADR